MTSNRKTAVSGLKWMTISMLTVTLVTIFRLSVLTRFLEKTDFGIVAILSLVLGLTQVFAVLGFSTVIMHKRDISTKDFSSLYWIQLLTLCGFYTLASAVSPLIALFYEEPSLVYLLPFSLLALVFGGIGSLYDTILQKEFRFRTIAIRNIITAVLSAILAILLAVYGFGVYSLVLSTLFQTLSVNLWNAVAGQKYMRLQFVMSVKENIPLIKIGLYQTGTQIIDYTASHLDVLIIGKLLGTELLGVYSLAKNLAVQSYTLVNSIANKVILPFFSKVQNDNASLRSLYTRVLHLLSLIDFPFCLAMCVLSIPIVSILYGDTYSDAAEIVSILAIWSLFVSMGNPVGNLTTVKGRTDLSFKYTLYRVVIAVPMVSITSLFSLSVVAWGLVVQIIIMLLVAYKIMIYKLIKLPFRDYVSSFGGVGIITFVTGGIVYPLVYWNVFGIDNSILQLLAYGSILAVIYLSASYFFYKESLIELFAT